MLSLCLILLCIVQIEMPLDLDSQLYSQNIRPKRESHCVIPKDTVTPINYKIELTPNYSEYNEHMMTFKAEVHIQFLLEKSLASLQLHAVNLRFTRNYFYLMTFKETVSDFEIKQDYKCDIVDITKSNYIFKRGLYMLKIMYEGVIVDYSVHSHYGLFKGFYTNDENEKKMFINTQLDPLLAHTVFPCFDEPKYKATFQLIIHHAEKYKVISNMPILKQTLDTTEFMTTPSMSPNLLSFTICDFEYISSGDNLTVYVRPDIIKHASFGLNTATCIFKAYEEYFNLRPKEMFDTCLFKLDLLGLPDFEGPVHALGVISINENNLIYDEQNPPAAAVLQVRIESIATAIVQQWLRNFVNINDWKYAWINDGLKFFLTSYIVDKILENNWRSMDKFVFDRILITAFVHDEKEKTPLENNVVPLLNSDPKQKAPAIIHMMQHFLTESVFRRGLQLYLTKHKKNPVDSNDLLTALQDAAHEANMTINLKAVMKGWLEYPGYPILTVTRDYDKKTMEITQKRFRLKDLSGKENNVRNLWHIPINYATAAKPDFHITTPDQWMKDNKTTIAIKAEKGDWLILNKQVSGFYRINYDKENWHLIIDYLKSPNHEKIHALNRAQLLIDALTFVQQNTLDLEIFLRLTTYLEDEKDHIAWLAASKAFEWLDNKLFNSEFYPAFKHFSVKSIENWINLVGYEEKANDEHITKISREETLKHACKYGDSSCLSMMEEKLKKWFNAANDAEKNKIIPPDNVNKMICLGLQRGNFDLYNKTFALVLNTEDGQKKLNLIRDLGCSRNKTTLKAYLEFFLNHRDHIPLQKDIEIVIDSLLSRSEEAFAAVFEFFMKQYDILVDKIKLQTYLDKLFVSLAKKITTKTDLERLMTTTLLFPQNVMDDANGNAERNMQWLAENKEKLECWLNNFCRDVKSPEMQHRHSASIILTLSSLFITLICNKYLFNLFLTFIFKGL